MSHSRGQPQVGIDLANLTIDIKKTQKTSETHPNSVYAFDYVSIEELEESLYRLAVWVKMNGVDADGRYRAGRDLLLRRPPRLGEGEEVVRPGESALDAAKRLALSLDHSVLAIQGPPGAGKTYTAARMICALVAKGRKVGVAAVSHKVIRKLLEEVVGAAKETKQENVACVHKVSGKPEEALPSGISETTKNEVALAAFYSKCSTIISDMK